MKRPIAFGASVFCTLAIACGEGGAPSGPRAAVAVVVTTDRATALPGDTVTATVTATPTDGGTIDYIVLVTHGAVAAVDSLPFVGAGARTLHRTVVVPPDTPRGRLAFSASARSSRGAGSGEREVPIADDAAPAIASATHAVNATGDTVVVSVQASDNAGIAAAVVRFDGAFMVADTVQLSYERSASFTVRRAVPMGADFAVPLSIAVEVYDAAPNHGRAELAPVTLRDDAPPAVRSAFLGWAGTPTQYAGESAFQVGEQVTLRLDAADNVGLAWVGFRLGTPAAVADSVAVGGSAEYAESRALVVPAAWRGVSSVTFFARDGAGHLTESAASPLSVYGEVPRATRVTAVTGRVADAVYDAKRRVVYLSQPDEDRVLVLSTATMEYGTPIAAPGGPTGVDLTPGGDSLLIALRDTKTLGVVDLAGDARRLDAVPLAITDEWEGQRRGPAWVRTTSRGTALVSLTFDGSGYGGQLIEVDLRTGSDRVRTDAGINGRTGDDLQLTASGDRSTVIMVDVNFCCGVPAQLYSAGADTFGPTTGTIDTYGVHVSTDERGDAFLIASGLYGPALAHLRTFAPPHFDLAQGRVSGTMPTAMSPGGDVGYFAVADHYFKLRLADGGVLEKVFLPTAPARFLIVDGGAALLSLGATQAALVDLR